MFIIYLAIPSLYLMDDYLLMSSFDVKFFSASIADDEGMEEEKVDGDDSFNEQNDDWLRVMVDGGITKFFHVKLNI